jgi:hypothetical protein
MEGEAAEIDEAIETGSETDEETIKFSFLTGTSDTSETTETVELAATDSLAATNSSCLSRDDITFLTPLSALEVPSPIKWKARELPESDF